MKINNKTTAVLVSAVSALSALSVLAPVQLSAGAADLKKINVNAVKNTEFNIDKYNPALDFGRRNGCGKDQKNDYYDFLVMETEINDLFAAQGYPDRKLACNAVTLSDDAQKAGLTPYDLDLTKDGHLSPEDYCIYLRAISKDYNVTLNKGDSAAEITAYKGKNTDELVVPASVYDDDYAVILPVMGIASNAFSSCTNLHTLYLSDYRQANWINCIGQPMNPDHKIMASTYLNIREGAFTGCDQLSEVYFPQNLVMANDFWPVDGFSGTPFSKDPEHCFNRLGVYYYKDCDTESPKIVAFNTDDRIYDYGTEIAFIPGTTSINNKFFESFYYSKNDIENVVIPFSVKYIGFEAFAGAENLSAVNGVSFSGLDSRIQDTVIKFVNAFNRTPFMAEETQNKLDDIIAELAKDGITKNSPEADKELAAAKAVVKRVTYSSYTTGRSFSLYPDGLYNTIDFSRANYASEHAGLNTGFTECGGIAATYSLLLDMLDVKNYRVGGDEHSFNVVNINGSWRASDLSGTCGNTNYLIAADPSLDRAEAAEAYADSLTSADINSDLMRVGANLYGEPSFSLFEASKDKQFTDEENAYYFVLDDTDRSKLRVYCYTGEDGNTSAPNEINDRLAKFSDNTVTAIELRSGLQQVGNIVYFINDYSGTMQQTDNFMKYEDLKKAGHKFDDWSYSYKK